MARALALVLGLVGCTPEPEPELSVDSSATPPELVVEILAPIPGHWVEQGQPTLLSGRSPGATELLWSSDMAGALGEGSSLSAVLPLGEQRVLLEARDATGASGQATVDLVVHAAPSAPALAIEPPEPQPGEALQALVLKPPVDPEGEAITYRWAWSVDGAPAGVEAAELPAGSTQAGQRWEVELRAEDAHGLVGEAGRAEAWIAGDPTIETATIEPSAPTSADSLRCVHAIEDWQELRWLGVDEVAVVSSAEELSWEWTERGERVSCEVVDAGGQLRARSAQVEIGNAPPVPGPLSVEPVAPASGEPLSCVHDPATDADADADALTRSYAWSIDGVLGAFGPDPVLAEGAPGGAEVRCALELSDGLDPVTALSEPVSVDNLPPTAEDVVLTPAAPDVTDAITCSWTFVDADGGSDHSRVQWWVDGVDAGTSNPLTSGFARDQTVICELTPDDGLDAGAPVEVSAVVGNAPPSAAGVEIEAAELVPGGNPSCVAVDFVDPDGDPDLSTRQWWVDGVEAGSGAQPSVELSAGALVECELLPHDGLDAGDPVRGSATVNHPPEIAGLELLPDPLGASDRPSCVAETADADGDPVSIRWVWRVDGVEVGDDSDSLDHPLSEGEVVECSATPEDGWQSGSPTSRSATVVNLPPEVVEVRLSNAAPVVGEELWAEADVWDAEGDAVELSWRWEVDGLVEMEGSDRWVVAAEPGAEVVALATPADASGEGEAMASDPAVVQNQAPDPPVVELAPELADPGLDDVWCLIAEPGVDPEGSALDHEVEWTVNGVLWAGSTLDLHLGGDGLPAAELIAGDALRCRARASDGLAWSDWSAPSEGRVSGGPQLALGREHGCVIFAGGQVDCWGNDLLGQLDAPSGRWQAVAAGQFHGCALDVNGQPSCWGYNVQGQASPPPVELVAVDGGERHSCGVDATGLLHCWGEDDDGQSSPPADRAIAVCAGGAHSCALSELGELLCWGDDSLGQASPPAGGFISLSCGSAHSCAQASTGELWCWGDDSSGQASPPGGELGMPAAGQDHSCALDPAGLPWCWGDDSYGQASPPAESFVTLASGDLHSCGMRADGTVRCWGSDSWDRATSPYTFAPQLAVGRAHACALDVAGSVDCWGDDALGQASVPAGVFVDVAAGGDHSCALDEAGVIRCWGALGGLEPGGSGWLGLSSGEDFACAIEAGGRAQCWGSDADGQLGVPETSMQALSAGGAHACALDLGGELWCWGSDAVGQASPPTGSFVDLAAGGEHSCALDAAGELWCWGSDSQGQSSPGSGPFAQLAAGAESTCALDEAGLAWCWGGVEAPEAALQDLGLGAALLCALGEGGAVSCWGVDDLGQVSQAP